MPEIILINSKKPQTTQTLNLTPETELNQECLLGRDDRCCIVLNDSQVSRIHGKFFVRNGNYYYTDLGSRNGSRLNNEMVKVNQNYLLKTSDTLAIGNYILWIKSIREAELPTTISQSNPKEYMPLATIDPNSLERWQKGELNVRCVQITAETHDVKTFSFVAEPPVLFTYQPGQFVTLDLEINGKQIKRSYSLSSSPSRPHTLDITVKRVPAPSDEPNLPPGLVSNWLHDNIKIGSQVKLSGPLGKFTCFANPAPKLLFISAGSGITPMMSMSRWLCDTQSAVDIVFLHSTRSSRDFIFRQELKLIASRYPRFKLAVTLTRPEPGKFWLGYRGRLNKPMLTAIAPDFAERHVYVCGPNPFMAAVKSILQELNFPPENYYEESFGTPKPKKAVASPASINLAPQPSMTRTSTESIGVKSAQNGHRPASAPAVACPVVVLAKSGQEIVCDGEESILEIAQAHNIDLPYGCGMGACGQCKLGLLEGKVTYDEEPDCEAGQILTCIAKPLGKVVIDA